MTAIDWFIVVALNALVFGFAAVWSRKTKSDVDWFLGGRNLPFWLVGMSMFATSVDGGEAILVNLPDGVTFATGSATISPAFRDLLDNVAGSLRQYPNSLVDVYGYTDTVGSSAANQRLSDQRAQAVANYLISQGVASSRIRWMGFGETQLKVQTGDNVANPLNRRVEIKIIPFDAQDVNAARQQGM